VTVFASLESPHKPFDDNSKYQQKACHGSKKEPRSKSSIFKAIIFEKETQLMEEGQFYSQN
jgi:hypothetical protein